MTYFKLEITPYIMYALLPSLLQISLQQTLKVCSLHYDKMMMVGLHSYRKVVETHQVAL